MISKNTIDIVYETARVEEVIGDFVQLKRAGSNYKGLSPFSQERTPSFMVSPVKQIWKDFSTGKGGNVVAFLMEHEHFTYPEAIKYLAKKYNIEIEETLPSVEDLKESNEKESLYLVSEFAKNFFQEQLFHSEEGKAIGLTYFKERGFTLETIQKFGLGYSPNQWDAFTNEALSKSYQLEYLEKTGLTIVNEEKKFDRFKGRVMFPIQSMSGRVLGFGGRILTNDKKAAKYLNSPESEIYYKSKVLYGINFAKQAIAKNDMCYLVEGYTDVIQMHQAGLENVVSSSGTALTTEQIKLINRLTKNITVLFDGDAAGLRASIRGIDLILEEGMNVKICTFPEGEDPDSFSKKTPYDELLNYLNINAKDFIQFKATLLVDEAKNDPIKKAELIRDMVNSISKIPDKIKKEIYIQECSRIMDISEEVLFSTLAQISKKELQDASKKHKEETQTFEVVKTTQEDLLKVDIVSILEKSIIELLLLYGDDEVVFDNEFIKIDPETGRELEVVEPQKLKIYEKIFLSLQEDEVEFSNENFKQLLKIIQQKYLQGNFDKNKIIHELDETLATIVTDIVMNEEKYQLHGWLDKKQVFVKPKNDEEVLKSLVQENITALREYLITQINFSLMNDLSNNNEESNTNEILSSIAEYNKLKVVITRKIGRMRSKFH